MKLSLFALLLAFGQAGYANETTYSYMDSAAPHDQQSATATTDHARSRTTVIRDKDEISDTASVNQSATRRDYGRENDPMRRANSPGCGRACILKCLKMEVLII